MKLTKEDKDLLWCNEEELNKEDSLRRTELIEKIISEKLREKE